MNFKRVFLACAAMFSLMQPTMAGGLKPDTLSHTAPEQKENWLYLGTGEKIQPLRRMTVKCDVAVIGGGMSGISAAVAAARQGVNVILINDRPMLGGNASSEMRMTVNGSTAPKWGRETGIVEELLIANKIYNPQESYHIWDHVMYDYVKKQENLTLMLNTSAIKAVTEKNRIKSVICWQMNTETELTLVADQFIDCTGDGVIGASAGAEYRTGREGKKEFGEKYAPDEPDGWVMGETIMMITRDMGRPVPYKAPSYAKKYNGSDDKHRKIKVLKEGFWWVEIGNDYDIIQDREKSRDEIMAWFYGVWDYVKNSGKYPEAENLVLDWVGSLPGKRESRRLVGDYMLFDQDMLNTVKYEDAVAWGGWSLDEHCPGGILNLKDPASYFHERFIDPYQIPYRCLYSKNIENLLFAGRCASVSHVAQSSTRIIGTCCMMGQATGVASAMCIEKKIDPREVGTKNIKELQERMLRQDYYIPYIAAEDPNNLIKKASKFWASSTASGDVKLLLDGIARDGKDGTHHWMSEGDKATLNIEWAKPIKLSSVEFKFDTNLVNQLMMHKDPIRNRKQVQGVPPELVKSFTIEAKIKGEWKEIAQVTENETRYVPVSFKTVKTDAIRINLNKTYGAKQIKMYELRCY